MASTQSHPEYAFVGRPNCWVAQPASKFEAFFAERLGHVLELGRYLARRWAGCRPRSCSEIHSARRTPPPLRAPSWSEVESLRHGEPRLPTVAEQQRATRPEKSGGVRECEGVDEVRRTKCARARLCAQRMLRDMRRAARGVVRAKRVTKSANELEGLRNGEERWERVPRRW